VLAYLPMVEQVDAHTIRFVAKDMVEVSRFIEFLTNYDEPLTP
jgi:D-amino peptidase